jgi:gamma-glutamyltranspeptidase/glutathione hydrolase
MTSGAVASGHPQTTAAGIAALELGGNAVDAAIAAALAATACEALLTGFGGGGLMTIREARTGTVRVIDFFSAFPGLDHGLEPREFTALVVDYGPTQQTFHAGRGAVAVPGIPRGLQTVHDRFGSLPRDVLAAPAARLAREGWEATEATEIVAKMLETIIKMSPASGRLFAPGGRPLRRGDRVRSDTQAVAIEDWGRRGAEPFVDGHRARALLDEFGPPHGSLGPRDLAQFEPVDREPITVRVGSATLHSPGAPCSGGPLLAFGLELLRRLEPSREPLPRARALAAVMDETDRVRAEFFDARLFDPAATEELLDPAGLDRRAEQLLGRLARAPTPSPPAGPPAGSQPGNTTHISVVDSAGNAVSYTSSNGETCGYLWPGTDLPVNNFLGEDDINPLGFHVGTPGCRLRTGMTPSVLVGDDGEVVALGTGGSNRIRTAMLQVLHAHREGSTLREAVMAPRIHVEGDTLQAETADTSPAVLKSLGGFGRALALFEGRHLYFGGVHTAVRNADGSLDAVGDPRRAGDGAVIESSSQDR